MPAAEHALRTRRFIGRWSPLPAWVPLGGGGHTGVFWCDAGTAEPADLRTPTGAGALPTAA